LSEYSLVKDYIERKKYYAKQNGSENMTEEIEIPEFPEDEESEFDYPMFQSHEIVPENDQVTIGDITVKTGNVWNAAKIACILIALTDNDIDYVEAMKKIDEIKPKLF
jgi:hypothetical protein